MDERGCLEVTMGDLRFLARECILGPVESGPVLARSLVSVQQSRLSSVIFLPMLSSRGVGLKAAVVSSYCTVRLKWISALLRGYQSAIASSSPFEVGESL